MRNRINKSNMTKFDYTARTLGIIGAGIMAVTFIFGGTILVNLLKENRTLTNALAAPARSEDVNKTKKIDGQYIVQDGNDFIFVTER